MSPFRPEQTTRFSESRVFWPFGAEHFYDSFALESQISVRREAMRLFGLREDELMLDLHITRDECYVSGSVPIKNIKSTM